MTEESKQKMLAAGYGTLIEWAEDPILQTGYAGFMFNETNKQILVDRRKFPCASPVAPANTDTVKNILTIAPVKKLTFKDIKGLTKENFFDYLYEISNGAFQLFCEWIDEYKHDVGWNRLFNDEYGAYYEERTMARIPNTGGYPKFHDLPLAMQIGIFVQFFIEQGVDLENMSYLDDFLTDIMEWFYERGQKDKSWQYEPPGTAEGLDSDFFNDNYNPSMDELTLPKDFPKYFLHPRTGNVIKIIKQIDLTQYQCQVIADDRIYFAPRRGEDLTRHHDPLTLYKYKKLRKERKQLSLF